MKVTLGCFSNTPDTNETENLTQQPNRTELKMKTNTLRRLTFSFLAALTLSSVPAMAAPEEVKIDPEVAAAAKTLMATMKVEEGMGPALEGVKNMQNAMLEQQGLSEDEIASAKEIMAVSMEETEKALAWENLEGLMVRAYASVFTKAEIDGLIALFETPAGQAYIAKQGQLQAATMREMQTVMMDLMPKIQEKTAAAIKRAKNKKKNKDANN